MNFKVIKDFKLSTIDTDFYLKDSDNNDWIFRISKTKSGKLREFKKYPKHWKALLTSTSLANLNRKSHLYDLAMKAIELWDVKKDLTPETSKTFNDLIDEL
jgi:hypothetical protein